MNKKTVRDIDLTGKRVLVRVDFNVPLDGETVTDDTRVRAALPTIQYIIEQNPRYVALMSHLGRPKGEVKPEFSLRPVAPVLSKLLGVDVAFAEDCVGDVAQNAANALPDGGVLLLENTRFHAEERKNDPDFAKQLAELGDVYVNDAFGSAHRAHASTEGVTHYLPAVGGLYIQGGQWVLRESGQPLDLDATYHLLTTDFMYAGGDDYRIAEFDPQAYNTAINWRQPVIDWIIAQQSSPEKPLDQAILGLVK